MGLRPKTATIVEDDKEKEIPITEVALNDTVVSNSLFLYKAKVE